MALIYWTMVTGTAVLELGVTSVGGPTVVRAIIALVACLDITLLVGRCCNSDFRAWSNQCGG